VRSVTHPHLPALALMIVGFLPVIFLPPALAGEDGYRLLELDGYKVKWGDRRLGVGARVSYAFAGEALRFDDAFNCRDLAPVEALLGDSLSMEALASETAAAFRVWERAAGLSFHEVGDPREADIILGAQGQPRGRAFANVSYGPDTEEGVRSIERALVCLNPEHEWKVGFDGNEEVYDIRYTLIHEIGHAIGLDHPGASGQVMAFSYTEAFADLQPGDLRGIQRLYGPATRHAYSAAAGHPFRVNRPGTYPANPLTGNSVVGAPEEGIASISNPIVDRDGSIVPENVSRALGIGEK
jgi:hypothetical protein